MYGCGGCGGGHPSHACLSENNHLERVIKIKPKCANQPMEKALQPDSELVIITNESPVVNTAYIAAESPLALLSGKALTLLGWRLVLRTAYR